MSITVKRLIQRLQQMPQDLPVMYWYDAAPRGDVNHVHHIREHNPPDGCPYDFVCLHQDSRDDLNADWIRKEFEVVD